MTISSKDDVSTFNLFTVQPRNGKQKVLAVLLVSLIFSLLLLDWSFVRYRLLNESPSPGFLGGQKVVTWRWAYLLASPRYSDLVIYSLDNNLYHTGKVVAVPGDHVSAFNGSIYINGAPLPAKANDPKLMQHKMVSVPNNYVGVWWHQVQSEQDKFKLIPVSSLQGKILGHWQVLLI